MHEHTECRLDRKLLNYPTKIYGLVTQIEFKEKSSKKEINFRNKYACIMYKLYFYILKVCETSYCINTE